MKYRIIVSEVFTGVEPYRPNIIDIYEQTIEGEIDLMAIINAFNKPVKHNG